jgi:RNA polymerase sporulation-specific sigma factor
VSMGEVDAMQGHKRKGRTGLRREGPPRRLRYVRHLQAVPGKIVGCIFEQVRKTPLSDGRDSVSVSARSEMVALDSYQVMVDEEVVEFAREGDAVALEYLINKYKNFVRAKARSYFLIGADKEDIVQEGMIGLYKAIRDFRLDKLSSFRAFAELCITRQIITAIKTATRQKHIPLNSYVSLNRPIYDEDSDRTLLDVLPGTKITDPEELIISREEFDDIEGKMGEILSSLEWKVLMSYLEGKSYQEIAEDLKRHVKSIDNALQRVKRKLERYLEKREA